MAEGGEFRETVVEWFRSEREGNASAGEWIRNRDGCNMESADLSGIGFIVRNRARRNEQGKNQRRIREVEGGRGRRRVVAGGRTGGEKNCRPLEIILFSEGR